MMDGLSTFFQDKIDIFIETTQNEIQDEFKMTERLVFNKLR